MEMKTEAESILLNKRNDLIITNNGFINGLDNQGRVLVREEFDYNQMICELTDCFKEVLKVMPDNPEREGLIDTPKRVAKAYAEFFKGYAPMTFELRDFESGYGGLIVRKQIPFVAFCEHHMCPFPGTIDFAYIPDGKVLGLSKIIRFMQHFTSRLWIQEDMTTYLIDKFMEIVEPKGAAIIVEACHTCESYRGVKEANVPTITAAVRGVFEHEPGLEARFYQLVGR